ncbi:diguanylate phosphodiesterase [Actinotalea ferrariae CF5-4]|uniref:Diguanylate phosphodiesterase n=1 Tax=Actinotalea ferrariae CF5-4 TaxID=948458 RepID=A0A021VWY6_9CELL|nr:bifunctional diguanylate cyclase/phosphodiesterase [Actinotalea ferrariae]EYR63587.1 diguanylate phosphodiesterase [Actinotalea ferrariae CF5-4]
MITRTAWSEVFASPYLAATLFLVVAAIVGELRPLVLTRNDQPAESLSTSAPFVLALVSIAGVGVAVTVQALASFVDDLIWRRDWRKSAFNTGQYVLSVLAARLVFCLISGEPFFGPPVAVGPSHILPLLAGGVAMVFVNRFLVAFVIALAARQPLRAVVAQDARFHAATHLVLLCVGGVAADVAEDGVAILALLAAPVAAVYLTTDAAIRHAHQAWHDSLTNLGNRDRLQQQLARAMGAGDRTGSPDAGPGLVLLDLDHFKDINDTLGHPVGDHLLKQVADRLRGAVDLEPCRLGGDEFAVVVDGGLDETLQVAQALLASLEQPMRIGDLELLVRASAGVAVAPTHGADAETLMKNADIALYHAKLERDRISAYSAEFDVNTVDRLQLLADLRTALDTDQLAVAYQPQVDLVTRRTVGVEALVRWNHPARGLVPPDDFIPLAENSGLIGELTTYVLDAALSSLAVWRASGHQDLLIAVNLSARQLSDLALPRSVQEVLARHDVPPSALILEVTETGILSDPARVDAVIAALREMGVAIAVDDYGTGHASLSYLKRLEIDELKVDRSFVSDMGSDHHDFVIVRSTIALARDLGLRVVAEGIEDENTAHTLRDLGCHVGQGFHLGRPTTARAVLERLDSERASPGVPTARSAPR